MVRRGIGLDACVWVGVVAPPPPPPPSLTSLPSPPPPTYTQTKVREKVCGVDFWQHQQERFADARLRLGVVG